MAGSTQSSTIAANSIRNALHAWVVLTTCVVVCALSSTNQALASSALPRLLPVALDAVEPLQPPWATTIPVGPWQRGAESRLYARLPLRSPLESEAERLRRIAEHRPQPIESAPVEGASQQRAALAAARLFEAAGDRVATRFAYERALALGADRVEVWRGLARARLAQHDGPGAEAALLGALEALSVTTDAIAFVELRAQIHRDLAKLYLLEGRDRDATIALEAVEGLGPLDPSVRHWLVDRLLPLDLSAEPRRYAPPPVWPEQPAPDLRAYAKRRLQRGYEALPEELKANLGRATSWLDAGPRRRLFTTIGIVSFALLLLLRLIRQRGDLIVAIEYPEELRGVFRVRLSTSRARYGSSEGSRAEVMKGGVSTHYEHHLVNRETHFHRLLTRRYFVTVEGVLTDPETGEILSDYADKEAVRVRHRRTVRIEFDAQPDKCPVDVVVLWDDKPAEDVSVVAAGVSDSLAESRGNRVRLLLDKGGHTLVVGCGDRVMEREVDVQRFQPTRVEVDLAGGEVVFKGCPPAVQPYLRGDIETVAKALERDGQETRAYQMLAQMNRQRGEPTRAADYFESAGQLLEAAELRAGLGDHLRAAGLFLQAKAPLRAAEMYEAAGDLGQAGQAFEVAGALERAVECYRDANDVNRWIDALQKQGQTFEAAKVALAAEQRPWAIRLLQCIAPADPDYAESSWLLAEAFEREEHWDLAAQKLEQHIATYRLGTAPAEKYARLADLFEQAGSLDRAVDVLEDLRRREPTYPNVASRIEYLRKQMSAVDRLAHAGSGATSGDAQTAFVSQHRYEIVEEIGRGGMGVVFEARDTRLDRVVALKRLPEDLKRHHPRAVPLFLREAQAAARLNHPNIVTVFDTDQENGVFFITMELLAGKAFNRILSESGPLPVASLISVGLQVAAGLEYAHARGIIHRDVKTANLFLTVEKRVKIMDFGLAKMFEEVRGGTTIISGTPFYMSPEQILGGTVDQRTDLYSLGVTLFELATGSVPFAEGDVAYHHRHTAPPDPRELRVEIPVALAEIILALLEKDPERRLGSAATLRARLEALRGSLEA